MLEDLTVTPLYSSASIWEVAFKARLGRDDFQIDPRLWRAGLNENGYDELYVDSGHALLAGELPLIHKDPFDRMLIAQAKAEGIMLITADPLLAVAGAVSRDLKDHTLTERQFLTRGPR